MQWDIEDFKILLGLEDGLERIRLPFEFGPETGIKSRWEFFFCKDSRGWMGFWLKMLKFEETNINVEVSGRLESQGAIELAQRDSDIGTKYKQYKIVFFAIMKILLSLLITAFSGLLTNHTPRNAYKIILV